VIDQSMKKFCEAALLSWQASGLPLFRRDADQGRISEMRLFSERSQSVGKSGRRPKYIAGKC
jgi:hypothetical protein